MVVVVRAAVQINQEDKGRLIGPKGSTIKRIQAESGARVSVQEQEVLINGADTTSVDTAKRLISQIIGGNGCYVFGRDMPETTISILTADNAWRANFEETFKVDLLISKRDVVLSAQDGSDRTAEDACVHLREYLEDQSEMTTMTIRCETSDQLQAIQNNSTLDTMRTEGGGLQLDTHKDDAGLGITLKGRKYRVEKASKIIQMIIEGSGACGYLDVRAGMFSANNVAEEKWHYFLHDIASNVENRLGVRVTCERSSSQIAVTGDKASFEKINLALDELREILVYYYPAECNIFYVIPEQAMPAVAGRENANVTRLCGKDSVLSMIQGKSAIWICATPNSLRNITCRLEGQLADWKRLNRIIPIPDKGVLSRLIGPRGENLRLISSQTNCLINTQDTYVHVQADNSEWLEGGCRAVEAVLADWTAQQEQLQARKQYYGENYYRQDTDGGYGRRGRGGNSYRRW